MDTMVSGASILCLGYQSESVKQYFLNYRLNLADVRIDLSGARGPEYLDSRHLESWDILCAETGLHTGTGGRLWRIRPYLDGDTFLCTYGDGIGNVDLQALLDHHRVQGRVATVTGVRPTSRYGELEVDGDIATEFNEKSSLTHTLVSGGFFVFDRRMFDYLTDEEGLSLEYGPLRRLAHEGELAVFEHRSSWLGMDTQADLSLLSALWASGEAPWRIW